MGGCCVVYVVGRVCGNGGAGSGGQWHIYRPRWRWVYCRSCPSYICRSTVSSCMTRITTISLMVIRSHCVYNHNTYIYNQFIVLDFYNVYIDLILATRNYISWLTQD